MLHIVSRSPYQHSALKEALNYCQQGDCVILINDAVYALQGPHALVQQFSHKGIVLKSLTSDSQARGINPAAGLHICMGEFVDAVFAAEKNISWY